MNNPEIAPQNIIIETEPQFSKNVCCGIYGLRNKLNGKWYIGQSKNIGKRWNRYKNKNCKGQPKLYNALNKYGYDNFEPIILETCDTNTQILNEREVYWIGHHNSILGGYNSKSGGTNGRLSDDSIQKIKTTMNTSNMKELFSGLIKNRTDEQRARHKAACNTPEFKARTREIHLGKTVSPDAREKTRQANIGRPKSDATRKKLSDALRGRKLSDEHKEKLRIGSTGQVFSEERKKNIGDALRGRKLSEEHKRHVSEATKVAMQRPEVRAKLIDREISESTRKKLGEVSAKRWESPEFREKMKSRPVLSGASHYNFGKKCSEETKNKISETKRRKREAREAVIASASQAQYFPNPHIP